jgi:hypothetical protein
MLYDGIKITHKMKRKEEIDVEEEEEEVKESKRELNYV